jgi:hypothetical protein
MGNLELTSTVKMLQGQRSQLQKDLAKLDKAIDVLSELSGTTSTLSANGNNNANGKVKVKKHTMSAAARRRIGQAQKARWAKIRQAQKAKG